jgi:hypothetical protein
MSLLGSHSIDFSGTSQKVIETIGTSLSRYQFENLQFFITYEQTSFEGIEHLRTAHKNDRWQFSDFSLAGFLGISDKRKVIAAVGPYGLMLRISDTYIEFLTPVYSRTEWYSPDNHQDVIEWRKCFKQIIALMGGSEAIYITQAYFEKHHDFFRDLNYSFSEKIETLVKKHGAANKPFTHYGNGKYPRYFLDTFLDL